MVSIVIPTYGRADMLSRAIDSVLEQSYSNIQVIVVNDNLETSIEFEKTIQIMEKYQNDSRVLHIADGKNVGGSLARNKGILVSDAEFISFLDDDDYFYPTKIEQQLNFMIEKKADLCICDMDIEQPNGQIIFSQKSRANGADLAKFVVSGNCYTPMILSKKTVLTDVGMFTETPRFQDHILMLKILEKAYKVCELHVPLFVHNNHDGARITKSNKTKISLEIRREIEYRHLDKLNKTQLRKYKFNHAIDNILYFEDFSKIKDFQNMLLNICDASDIYRLFAITKNILIKKI